MDIDELKADLAEATEIALGLASLLASAVESGDLAHAHRVAGRLRVSLHRVKCLKRLLVLEVAG